MTRKVVAIADVRPAIAATWDEVDVIDSSHLCLCCGQPGHYLDQLQEFVAVNGVDSLAIVVNDDGTIGDGHHRVVVARRLGITHLPVETGEEAGERWIRDHGRVGWLERTWGDVTVSEAAWWVATLIALPKREA